MKKDHIRILVNIFLVLLGNFIFSIAINSVIIPNELGEGGITGFSLFFLYVFNWNNAIVSFVVNTILLIIGWKFLDKKTIFYTILAIASLSIFLQYIHLGAFIPENTIVAPLVAGFLIGLSVGIVIHGNGTTAGTDILALMMKKYLGISVARGLLILDIMIITPLTFVIGLEKGVMTVITLLITSQVLSFILEGFNPRKAVTIVSNEHQAIAQKITDTLDRGITVLNGYGFYTQLEKHVLYIVISERQLLALQKIVHEIDPKAFVTVTDIHQVVGEGFTFFIEPENDTPAVTNLSGNEP
ncbi:YitT family protein [Globicatella sanguinis]|uniref:YitT family protein n=1 Tax=Globicatella sanguinis TaxID=13076 RepID=UPI000826B54C|nr:YitT family protein [Globicatella sanguinis]MDK7630747.1 YitT family protein [Globicatella sanguinis]WIK66803.1 YitT family protein [Globicatella sanguinis]WKT56208.1 YitT family protein [Globicatella sanguinis]